MGVGMPGSLSPWKPRKLVRRQPQRVGALRLRWTRPWWFSRLETGDCASPREAGWRHHDRDAGAGAAPGEELAGLQRDPCRRRGQVWGLTCPSSARRALTSPRAPQPLTPPPRRPERSGGSEGRSARRLKLTRGPRAGGSVARGEARAQTAVAERPGPGDPIRCGGGRLHSAAS